LFQKFFLTQNILRKYQKQIWKLAPKKKTHYTRSNPDPDPPAVFQIPNLVPRIFRKQEEQEDFVDSSPKKIQHNYIPTPAKVSFHPHTSPTSTSSSSTS